MKLLLVLVMIKCIAGVPRVDPLVSTPRGLLRGLQGDGYAMFLGVPYAVVDEHNPFGPSTPHPGFNSTFEAYHDDVLCIQVNDNIVSGTIQCLQLNVYVPNTAHTGNTLPVMVYIHGGYFVRNSKRRRDLSPKFLVKHDVIVVAVNYRLGPFGFLCVTEPGFNNQGLKDQVLALEWIKENIAAFGGDPNSITAFGQSAGAISIDIQLYANEGFVNRAILQSGTALTPWVITEKNDSIPIDIATKLGFTGGDVKAAIQYLNNKDPKEIIQVAHNLKIMSITHPLTLPCVETVGNDALLVDFPINLQPKVKGIDLMIGHTNKELTGNYPKKNYTNNVFREELLKEFKEVHDEEVVKHFYVGDGEINEELNDVLIDFASDFTFAHSTERSIDRYLEANANSVYRYLFSYKGGRNRGKVLKNLTSDGASHGDDLGYLFDMVMFEGQTPAGEDQTMIDVMTTMWTNFAKYGNPTPAPTAVVPVEWRPVDRLRRPYLSIENSVSLRSRLFHRRMAFWDLYYKLHGDQVKGYTGR